jgi:AcrR family transcriptional regulator
VTTARRGPGRRPGSADTRGQVLAAARAEFATKGYAGTTVRGIARAADVDPALVHHYFGSKDGVFAAAMELPLSPERVDAALAGPPEGLGERLVRLLLAVWGDEHARAPIQGMLASALTHEEAAERLRGFVTSALLGRAAERLELRDAELRVTLAASHLVGLAVLRFIVKVEPLASASEDEVVAVVAPVIQGYLVG